MEETSKWPYEFPASEDFPKSMQRSSVSGQLLVNDRYLAIYLYTLCVTFQPIVYSVKISL